MKTITLATLNWLHLIATVTWIGGITFVLFIAMPSAKEVLGSEASKMMGIISRRFTMYANYSILLLIITGVAIVTLDGGFPGVGGSNSALAGTFILKHMAVLSMVAIHFYRGLVLAPKISKAQPDHLPGLQKLSLNLVKVNCALGLGVLLLSAVIAVI
ncbi:MAG: DUF4149 domain-containing protein [Candidatus Aquicultor sp.]